MSGMIADDVQQAAARVLDICRGKSLRIVTAESCTGGLVAAALTEIAGSSDVFDRAYVVYSNAAKQAMLSVPASVLERDGAVSRAAAEAMAQGALALSGADLALAITGIAGPGGGSAEKPVGLVHFAGASGTGRRLHREKRFGDIGRAAVRMLSVAEALAMIEALANDTPV
jgi:nicotinamide-nucleotide amidase